MIFGGMVFFSLYSKDQLHKTKSKMISYKNKNDFWLQIVIFFVTKDNFFVSAVLIFVLILILYDCGPNEQNGYCRSVPL